ncbi:phosphorylated adapter RNA export protein-like [Tachyglossus aculeatus]|uniref:phosphorylated adapter RNA export protein-like n=1 Tax=Tachyglossus aculeatus TaxID=9261 RepID=UPI0018F716C7|nr:phosphorylated adapter RNA export protein-like [Tachyglossus aculeatus]
MEGVGGRGGREEPRKTVPAMEGVGGTPKLPPAPGPHGAARTTKEKTPPRAAPKRASAGGGPSRPSRTAALKRKWAMKHEKARDDGSSGLDADDLPWKVKREKRCGPSPIPFVPRSQKVPARGWGEAGDDGASGVLLDWSLDELVAQFKKLKITGSATESRKAGAKNHLVAGKLPRVWEEDEGQQEPAERGQGASLIGTREENVGMRRPKRKRPFEGNPEEGREANCKRYYDIPEAGSEEIVAREISHRLRVPQKELIARAVRIIGTKKAIELLIETAEVEQSGGILKPDGSGRETPGEVYLNVLRNTKSLTAEQIEEIFCEEQKCKNIHQEDAEKRSLHIWRGKLKYRNFKEDCDPSSKALPPPEDSKEEGSETKLGSEEAVKVVPPHD